MAASNTDIDLSEYAIIELDGKIDSEADEDVFISSIDSVGSNDDDSSVKGGDKLQKENVPPTISTGLFECGVCAKNYKLKRNFEQHMATCHSDGDGAQQISYGLNKGAEFSKVLIQKGSTKIMEKMTPEQKAFMCDERYKDGVTRVRQATHTAVQVSSWIVGKLGDAAVALGRQVAPHIKSTCVGYLPKSMTAKDEVDGHSTLDSVVEVAAGGLKGFSTVYQGLEQAAKSLLRNLAEETVQLVDYKYGKDAGHLTEHTLYSVGNIAMTGYNAKHLGVRAMVKRTAKDTGRAMFEGEEDRTQPNGKESSEQLTEKMLTKEK